MDELCTDVIGYEHHRVSIEQTGSNQISLLVCKCSHSDIMAGNVACHASLPRCFSLLRSGKLEKAGSEVVLKRHCDHYCCVAPFAKGTDGHVGSGV